MGRGVHGIFSRSTSFCICPYNNVLRVILSHSTLQAVSWARARSEVSTGTEIARRTTRVRVAETLLRIARYAKLLPLECSGDVGGWLHPKFGIQVRRPGELASQDLVVIAMAQQRLGTDHAKHLLDVAIADQGRENHKAAQDIGACLGPGFGGPTATLGLVEEDPGAR